MSSVAHKIRPERAADAAGVHELVEKVFGPGATTRAAWALREGVEHFQPLAHLAIVGGTIAGSIRFTPVIWGEKEVLMLGPLCVARHHARQGIGRDLMQAGMDAAHRLHEAGGHDVVILVGDLDYYRPYGFERISVERISLPRPVDPARVLGCSLKADALASCSGSVSQYLDNDRTG